MYSTKHLILASMCSLIFACGTDSTPTSNLQPQNEVILNNDSIVESINQERKQIETNISEPIIIETATLREKIKQKWQKIHFYIIDNQVVRIKTYPYNQISTRTEEFYLKNNELILAIIEDDGSVERKKGEELIDKMYYYHQGEIIKESKFKDEAEYGIRNSDAEELMQEVREYIDVFNTKLNVK
jgi:uncharacterized protein YcfL